MNKTILYLIGFLVAATQLMFPGKAVGQQPVVTTEYGQIIGNSNSGIFEFRGIPFASPPIGSNRWKPPLTPSPWTIPLLAVEYKPACPQKEFEQGDTTATLKGNEDCLYLNIWTPDTLSPVLPVMVFIHGGGNQQGSASEISLGTELYNGKNLAQRGLAVVVTLQYRLGVLGFLVHPGLEAENEASTSGNYAVMDQLLALTWIKRNIGNFGGDSTKIMIFGESAGGVNVGNLLTSPAAEGLFQRAVIQSAVPSLGNYEEAKNRGIEFVEDIFPSGSDSAKIAYMRSLPADSITNRMESPLEGGFVQMNWRPVIDGHIFPQDPETIFQSGFFNKVPLMIGSNADEMNLSAPATIFPFMVTALINSTFPPSLQAQAQALYPPGTTTAQARESYVQLLTDAQFTMTTRRTARCVSLNQEEPVFRYFFTHNHAGPLEVLGSYHGLELFYIFNNYENTNYALGPWYTPQDDSVQLNMLAYWSHFANTGNPNGNNMESWPSYQAQPDCYLEIKASPDGSMCGLRTEKSDLWDAAAGYVGCSSSLGSGKPVEVDFSIFPNPSTGKITISIPGTWRNPQITILNLEGRVLKKYFNENTIDIGFLSPGIYLVRTNSSLGIRTAKLIRD
jgi:para-nitrobenzyl esterase